MIAGGLVTLVAIAKALKMGKLIKNAIGKYIKKKGDFSNAEKRKAYMSYVAAQEKEQKAKQIATQKQNIKNEQLRQKVNTRLAGNNPNRNPVARFGFGELAPTPQVNVGAKIGEFKQQQAQNKAKGVGLPFANPQAREQLAKQQIASQRAQQQAVRKQQAGFERLENKKRKPKLGFDSPNTLKKPQPLNVGQKLGQYQKQQAKQNKAISKGLSNPVNKPSTEDKIKNIMGVN